MYQVFTEPRENTTKEFVATVNDMTVPAILNTADMQQSYFDGSKVLVHLTFLGNADEPVVARLIKNYGVDVNIIQGKIDYLKDLPYGTLLVEISGTKECLAKALEYIHQAKVKEEVIGYVS